VGKCRDEMRMMIRCRALFLCWVVCFGLGMRNENMYDNSCRLGCRPSLCLFLNAEGKLLFLYCTITLLTVLLWYLVVTINRIYSFLCAEGD
jgi:hypothetical protein